MSGEGSLFDVPPAAIGRYRVLHQVGAGTSGPVFRAVHPDTAAALAIKLFTLEAPADRAAAIAADLEGLVAQLPAIDGLCEPVDAGVHSVAPYLVTSYATGDSLDVALKQFGPAALIDLVPRLRTLARALDEAAARDVMHGAMHPRDVLVSESTTFVTGLGTWPILGRHGGRMPVRRPYRAPELAESAVTAAGDRFALAVLAYEWMTGRRAPTAFVARDMAALPGVDIDALARVFATALHADPGERYPSNDAFIDELEKVEVAEVEPVFAPEPPRSTLGTSRRRGRPGDEMPVGRLPLGAAEDADDLGPLDAPSGHDRREETPAVADLHLIPPGVEQQGQPDARNPRDTAPPPTLVVPPIQPAPDPAPPVPTTGRLFHGAGPEHTTEAGRPASGVWRLAAGLLLGAVLGIGAGYAVWGSNAVTQIETARDTTSPASDGAAAAPAAAESATSTPAATAPESSGGGVPSPGAASEGSRAPTAGVTSASETPGGNLLVRSTPPGATVFVDDRRSGVTPLTLQKVELGTRRVRIVRDGFTPEDRQVTLTRSRPSRSVDIRLTRLAPSAAAGAASAGTAPTSAAPAARTGSLLIESRPPAATIILNGRTIGVTPMTLDDLEPGTYTVQLQLITFRPITTTVRVVAGARARAAASLVSAQEPE